MRRVLNAALVLGAVFANVMASQFATAVGVNTTKNQVIVDGLYTALPYTMTNFQNELVPLP